MSSGITVVLAPRSMLRKLAVAVALCAPVLAQAQTAIAPKHMELIDAYCVACHNQEDFSGGFSFDLLDANNVLTDAETWEKVLLKLEAGMMPPPGKDRPERAQVEDFVGDVATTLDAAWE